MPHLRIGGRLRPLALVAVLVVASVLAGCSHAPQRPQVWSDAEQLVLVTVPGWAATTGELQRYQRQGAQWQAVGDPVPVSIGRAGAAWGVGLHPTQSSGPVKHEGDGRAPAGVFAIGTAFGYADNAGTRMPYEPMQASHYCIDVSASPLYNRIVDAERVGAAAVAGSTEPMRRDLHRSGDQRYRLGFVIDHNPANRAGAGSCIFAHLWKAPGEPTAGCTAMDMAAMQSLLAWLDPRHKPVFVLLPHRELRRLRREWNLPPGPDR